MVQHDFTDGSYTKRTRAYTHRELIREWLWEPKWSSLEYILVLGGEVDAETLVHAVSKGDSSYKYLLIICIFIL